jgi:hypothetical protein
MVLRHTLAFKCYLGAADWTILARLPVGTISRPASDWSGTHHSAVIVHDGLFCATTSLLGEASIRAKPSGSRLPADTSKSCAVP